jgi:hypothetical protein
LKIGLVGPTHDQRSLPFNAQRSINLFPVMDQQGKEVASLYSVPGKKLFSDLGDGIVRGEFASSNGRAFAVSGDTLYEVFSNGTSSSRGTLNTANGNISMDENATQMAICDGRDLYIYTYATDVFAEVTDPDLPPQVGYVTYLDGYFVINEIGSGRFFISALNNGTSWAALDFATAESSPDNLVAPVNAVGQLWLFGERTTEIWSNTGESAFPFRRISGAIMEVGCLSPHTVIEIDNSVFWIGKDQFGQGVVYRTQGFSPARISNSPIERRIAEATSPESLKCLSYQEEGHVFYEITGGGLETSLVYDLTTQQWHERAFLNDDGSFGQDLAGSHMFAFGKHLVGDRRDGKIYEQSLDFYDDGGNPLARERIYTHLSDEGQRIRYNALEIGFETGVGLQSGQGSNPLVSLQLSKDGARTWTDWQTAEIGKVGEYGKKVEFRRFGVAEIMTFKIRVTDPVKVAITGSYLR